MISRMGDFIHPDGGYIQVGCCVWRLHSRAADAPTPSVRIGLLAACHHPVAFFFSARRIVKKHAT